MNKGLLTFDIRDRLKERYSIILHFIKNGDTKIKRLESKTYFLDIMHFEKDKEGVFGAK